VLGAVDWANLVPASAFVLGAVLATVATLRVMRAVISSFQPESRRRLTPPRKDQPRD
jgi:hypothetical protein